MAGLIKNLPQVEQALAAAVRRARDAPVQMYRDAVWAIFHRIVMETPQFSGRAVANWNLGINAPDLTFDPNLGDAPDLSNGKPTRSRDARRKGDILWAEVALRRGHAVLERVKRGDKVYISNATHGDTLVIDRKTGATSHSSPNYLADLQDKSTWMARLRAANTPYETAIESATLMAEGLLEAGNFAIGGFSSNASNFE